MTEPIRMRRDLTAAVKPPAWPPGIRLTALEEVTPQALHAILTAAYATGLGSVPPFQQWWSDLIADSEFDPELVLVAIDGRGNPVGIAQCWTSGFVKDIAVSGEWRGKGIGEALLASAFQRFKTRGLAYIDLKVVARNDTATRLYRRMGMIEVPL